MAHENENGITRCLMHINGLGGYLVAVVGLLLTLGFLMYYSVIVQQDNASTYYSINQDIHAIKAQSSDNNSFRIIEK